jgi:hypothetical protein
LYSEPPNATIKKYTTKHENLHVNLGSKIQHVLSYMHIQTKSLQDYNSKNYSFNVLLEKFKLEIGLESNFRTTSQGSKIGFF